MARFFHTLVLAGASISAACGGESLHHGENDAGSGGTGADGGSKSAGGSAGVNAATGGTGTGGVGTGGSSAASGGVGAVGGAIFTTGGTAAGGTSAAGGSAGTIDLGGTSGTGMIGPLPEPGATAQWDCTALAASTGCVQLLGTTASVLPKDCPVDPTRPKTADDCPGQVFTCWLALTARGDAALVNCECQPDPGTYCSGLGNGRYGQAAEYDGRSKICACAYTGILK